MDWGVRSLYPANCPPEPRYRRHHIMNSVAPMALVNFDAELGHHLR